MKQESEHDMKISEVADNTSHNNLYENNPLRNTPCVYQKIVTQKQAAARMRFAAAVHYARSIVADPELKVVYAKMAGENCSAYSLAVSEYLLTMENGQWIF